MAKLLKKSLPLDLILQITKWLSIQSVRLSNEVKKSRVSTP